VLKQFPGFGVIHTSQPGSSKIRPYDQIKWRRVNPGHRFVESAELYDAIYQFKNYKIESERLRALIDEAVPAARTILDVACGTGEHARFLKVHFNVDV
jgi:hypothetical protein